MATQKEHFLYTPEVTFATYLAPTLGYIIRKGALTAKQSYEYPEETGMGRAQAGAYRLEKVVNGSIEASLRPENFAKLMKIVLATVVSTVQGAGPAYRHKFMPNDAVEVGSFSGQILRANGITQAFKGAVPKNLKIMAEAKQVARWSMDFVAKDSAVTGTTWADGSAAPAAFATPDTLYPTAPIQEPLKFFQGSVLFGGTKALTTGEIVVTGGVAQAGVRRCELTIDLGIDEDDFQVITDPTIQSAQASKRKITATIDIDQKVAAATFLNDHLAGNDKVLALDFTGPIIAATFPWLVRVVLPILKVTDAPQADIDGNQGLKRVTLELTAYADSSLAGSPDIGVTLQNKDVTV